MRNRVFRGSHIFSLQVKCVAMIFVVAVFIMPLAAVVSAKTQPATMRKGVKKMLILGDSITRHAPAKDLGWTGDWGMAASSEDKDFVHLLYAKLCASQEEKPELIASAVGGGTIADKLANLPAITAHAADLVIIQLGENDRTVTEEGFEKPYETLIEAAKKANPAVRVYCCSVWAEGAGGKNEMIKNACLRQGAVFVDISQVFLDSRGYASSEGRFTNSGVNWHPGDKGMQGYADALWKAMSLEASASSLAELELTLQVSPDREMGSINPRVFGATLSAKNVLFSDETTDRDSALRNLSESGLRLLRYPGGFVFSRKDTRECWSNFYWQDQIGHNKKNNPLDFYDIDTFLGFCEIHGIEPLMQVNFVGETEQSVDDYVSYLTAASGPWALKRASNGHPKPYSIKVWELGNELHDENQGFKGDANGAREYAAKVNTLIPKLRRQVPGSEIMLPYVNAQRPVSETGDKINLDSSNVFANTFLSELKVPVEFLDWHFYAANGWGTWKYVGTDDEWKHYYCWGTKFRECYSVIVNMIRSHYTMKPYPKLFVGEWSGDWTTDIFHGNPEAPRGSMEGCMASGIYLGDILIFLMRESTPSGFIGGACWHTACGGSQSLFHLKSNPSTVYNSNDASGIRPPVYWIFKLLSERRGEKLVHSQLFGDNSVDAPKDGLYFDPEFKFQRVVECCTISDDKLYVALLNKDASETVSVSIGIDSWQVLPEYGVHTVSAKSYLTRNTPENPDTIKIVSERILKPEGASPSYKVPPNTLAVLEFTRKRK